MSLALPADARPILRFRRRGRHDRSPRRGVLADSRLLSSIRFNRIDPRPSERLTKPSRVNPPGRFRLMLRR